MNMITYCMFKLNLATDNKGVVEMYIYQKINKIKAEEIIDISIYQNSNFSWFLETLSRIPKYDYLFDDLYDNTHTNHYFYTVCDLLSIDYDKLENELSEAFSRIHKNSYSDEKIACDTIISILRNYHYLLVSGEIGNGLLSDFRNNFNEIHRINYESYVFSHIKLLQEYINAIINGNHQLKDPHIFRVFALNYLHELTPEYTHYISNDEFCNLSLQEFIQNINNSSTHELSFYCESVEEFINANINCVLSKGLTFQNCKNCGKIFVPYHRTDTLYCDRKSPQDEHLTCKEYGTKRLWYENLKQNETKKLYRNIYMQKQMLSKRNPDIYSYQIDFENYKIQSKQWKSDVKSGLKTEEEYLDWLKSAKKRGAKNGQHNETE